MVAALATTCMLVLSSCATGEPATQETPEGMRATIQILDRFDGYLSVGLRIENLASAPLRFEDDDYDVIGGSGGPVWSTVFGPAPDTGEVKGYDVTQLPGSIAVGAAASTVFLVDENFDRAVITVTSLNGGAVTFSND
jgi:hypothetical protein